MRIQDALGELFERRDLNDADMRTVMGAVMTGEATPAQIGAFLTALRMKGETVEEVAAAAAVMRGLADGVDLGDLDAVDIVGTGGDSTGTFNVSTCSALVTAAAGVPVAKHGNRSVSSKSGAADFLEAAGVNIDLDARGVGECVRRAGIGFMFAPRHHSAMKHAIGPRREMGVRTLFNLLGPITNPAGVKRQLLGVYDGAWVRPLAEVLRRLGSVHVMVVHGDNGMDEISLEGPTRVSELAGGEVRDYAVEPGRFGIDTAPLDALRVDGAAESLALIRAVLDGEPGPATDVVLLNAGAAIRVGGGADTLEDGVARAREALASGAAKAKLAELVAVSRSLGGEGERS